MLFSNILKFFLSGLGTLLLNRLHGMDGHKSHHWPDWDTQVPTSSWIQTYLLYYLFTASSFILYYYISVIFKIDFKYFLKNITNDKVFTLKFNIYTEWYYLWTFRGTFDTLISETVLCP